jgi:hypothetical protein
MSDFVGHVLFLQCCDTQIKGNNQGWAHYMYREKQRMNQNYGPSIKRSILIQSHRWDSNMKIILNKTDKNHQVLIWLEVASSSRGFCGSCDISNFLQIFGSFNSGITNTEY